MSVVTVKDRARLRLGFEGSRGRTDPFGTDTQPPGRQTGVVVWGEERNKFISPGSLVFARVDRPSYLSTVHADDQQPIPPVPGLAGPQGYLFESAPQPAGLTIGGAAQKRGRQRILHVAPATPGVFQVNQQEPAWAAVGTVPGIVALVVEGNGRHAVTMPGQAGATPDLAPVDTHLLRVRWTGVPVVLGAVIGPDAAAPGFVFAATTITRNDGGDWTTEISVGDYITISTPEDGPNAGTFGPITVVTAGVLTIPSAAFTVNADDSTVTFQRNTTLVTLVGAETFVSGKWALRGDTRLVPGSIVMTIPGPFTVRDNGAGRLVGVGGGGERFDGRINYVTGDWELNIAGFVVGAGNITVGYEHSCLYAPLDIEIEWDALLGN